MSGIIRGAELFLSVGALSLGVFLIWIAKPSAPAFEPKFRFLASESGQVTYAIVCLCIFAAGLSIGFHGLVG